MELEEKLNWKKKLEGTHGIGRKIELEEKIRRKSWNWKKN